MLLHERECFRVADAVVELDRADEVGEQHGDTTDLDWNAGSRRVGAEQIDEARNRHDEAAARTR
jgi:hypothetical protein